MLGIPHFFQDKAHITFKMVSENTKLIVVKDQLKIKIFAIILQGISWAVLVIFFASLFGHKIIGL